MNTQHDWTLESGIAVCKQIEALLAPQGYHAALGGSVMYQGWSDKDLDVIVYPHKADGSLSVETINSVIRSMVSKLDPNAAVTLCESYGDVERDEKIVFVKYPAQLPRVDFFCLT